VEIAAITDNQHYHRVLAEIKGLMHAERGTSEGDRLEMLVTLVEAWESQHYPLAVQCGADPLKS